jgi:hypothetical protein
VQWVHEYIERKTTTAWAFEKVARRLKQATFSKAHVCRLKKSRFKANPSNLYLEEKSEKLLFKKCVTYKLFQKPIDYFIGSASRNRAK